MLVENHDFSYLHSTPLLGGPRRNISIPFGVEKLEWWSYPMVKKNFEDMYNRLDIIPACDRQTSCDGIVRAMHTRRAVKTTSPRKTSLKFGNRLLSYGQKTTCKAAECGRPPS